MSKLLDFVNAEIAGEIKSKIPAFKAGDTVNVHVKIKEGAKERIQQYQGVVLQIKNGGHPGETFTVRKISNSIAVERIFPMLSPSIDKIELVRQGKVRRAKLFYLREAKGKNARIKEKKMPIKK
jgi:large subunit ribosomal protein L19